jgi:hypothetical protein
LLIPQSPLIFLDVTLCFLFLVFAKVTNYLITNYIPHQKPMHWNNRLEIMITLVLYKQVGLQIQKKELKLTIIKGVCLPCICLLFSALSRCNHPSNQI